MEERKFVCKYCSKRFPCGKSLGGHIRTHMSEHYSSSAQGNEDHFDGVRKRKRDNFDSEVDGVGVGGGNSNNNMIYYGLRENPKKTTRFVHSSSNATMQQLDNKFCKECGKGFPSLKALCGHMACHSEKDKGTTNNNNRFENNFEKHKLVMDSQSDTETSSAAPTRRSRRMRFKTIISNNQQPPSSSVSEVEQEQEEVARCLMMLSKDSTLKGRFALVTESSDNNSVVLEAKSPSPDTKVKNSMSCGYELVVKEKNKVVNKDLKLKSVEVGYDSDNSDSGYFRYGPKKVVDSGDSNDGGLRNEVKSLKVGYFSGFVEDYDVESTKISGRGRSRNGEFKKFGLEEWEDGAAKKFDSRKRSIYGQNFGGNKVANGKYECQRDNDFDDLAYESDENSTDTDSYHAPKAHNSRSLGVKKSSSKGKKKLKSKKSKAHECPICNKIFRSGQALGGHKRSHFVGGSEENTFVIRPGAPTTNVPCLIDLNLPAPVDE